MKMYGGVEVQLHAFLTPAVGGGKWLVLRPGTTPTPTKEPPCTHWIGGWVGTRVGLGAVVKRKNHYPCRESNPCRPAHINRKWHSF